MVKPTAYSYVRFSTPEQLKGDSLRRQLDLSEQYAASHGLEIDTKLTLRDLGLSAFHSVHLERGALGVFVEAVRTGFVKPGSYLLIESLDRLSRASVPEALNLFLELTRAGVVIVTLVDGMRYSEQSISDNWTQLIMSLAIMARAHEESATKSKRLSAVWAHKKSQAASKLVTAMAPAWLNVSGDTFTLNTKKAATVREIFRLVRAGYGLHLIERKLNAEGVQPIGTADRWHRSYISKIVRNRAVIGEYQPMTGRGRNRQVSGAPIANYFPALISEEEFLATQRAIQDRTGKGGRKGQSVANLFSGLLQCGYCGGPVRYVNKNNATRWQYLVCSRAKSGLGCRHVAWNYHEVETVILSKLAELDVESILNDKSAQERRDALQASKARLADVRKRITNLVRLAEVAAELESLDSLGERLIQLRDEEKTATAECRELEISAEEPFGGKKHFERFLRLRRSLDAATDDERTELRLRINQELNRFLQRIELFPEGDQPWSYSMHLAGVTPGKHGRFMCLVFRTGQGRIFVGDGGRGTLWPGPKTDEGVSSALRLPFQTK